MLDSVWRVFGEEFDVDSFIKACPIPTANEIFRKGEKGLLNRPNRESGFSVTISENLGSLENIDEIKSFILSNRKAFSYLKEMQIHSEIDIGCTVGREDQFTRSVKIPTVLLGLLYEYGVSLEFSAYPASDEEEET